MKKSICCSILGILFAALPAITLLDADSDQLTNNEWRIYDVNGDGKFDKVDIEEFIGRGGIGFINDLNNDGNKDLTDAFALYVKLSVLDRNGDEAVDNKDFTQIDPIQIHEPDAGAVWSLVGQIVTKARTTLPADIEDQVFRSLPNSGTLTINEKAHIFQETGMSALLQQNLKAAQWAYGRAFQTNNRSASALGSLAFTVAVDNRHEDAMILLAYARKLFQKSGATSTSIGWIFARHGQNQEALTYYQEAVAFAPKIAQYHFNLGIAYLRIGGNKKACEEFKIASELDPGDFKAMLFRYVVPEVIPPPPKSPIDLASLKKEYELQISKMRESGAIEDELPTRWDDLSPCELARGIPEMLERKYVDKIEQIAQSYADEIAEKTNILILAYTPRWKKAAEDLERYSAYLKGGYKKVVALTHNAEIALGDREASLTRELGREIMSYSSFYMECALKQAQADANQGFKELNARTQNLPLTAKSNTDVKSDIYQSALEESIRECYLGPMLTGASYLKAESEPQGLPVSHVEVYPIQYYPLTIPDACVKIPGYCEEDWKAPEYSEPAFDNTFSLDLLIASFEYNANNGEWEFRVGQGIIFGATWSPDSGYGFQIGAGIDLDLVVAKFEAGAYLEARNNSLDFIAEGGGSIIGGLTEAGVETSGEYRVISLGQCTAQEPCPF